MGCLCRTLLLFQGQLETGQLLLHVGVDTQVPRHDHLHLIHVVVNIAVFGVLSLNILDQLSLLSDHVRNFLQVLQVVRTELFLLFHDVVDLFVERE